MKTLQTPIVETVVSGFLSLSIKRKGKVVYEVKRKPNLILNGAFAYDGELVFWGGVFQAYLYTSATPNFDDMNGTYQVAAGTAILTRASGTGTFAAGDVGKEVKFADGTRCHIITYTSTTQVTVSKTFPSGVSAQALRRYLTNLSSNAGSSQSNSLTGGTLNANRTAGTMSRTFTATFASATSAYSLASIMIGTAARIVLDTPVAVEIDDQISLSYTVEGTTGNRDQTFDMSSISGLPFPWSISTITGNGTYFDIVTTAAHHFAAGDAIYLDPAFCVPKRFAISSGSSTGSDFTINTAAAHGLNVGDSVVIENATPTGYNGTHVVATVPDADTFTVTSGVNPGALGASGTVRLATPVTYFGGSWTVASIPNGTTIRVTSTVTGPAVDVSATVKTASGAVLRIYYGMSGSFVPSSGSFGARMVAEANIISLPAVDSTSNSLPATYTGSDVMNKTQAVYSNDWLCAAELVWNAGTSVPRVKQIWAPGYSGFCFKQVLQFDNPQPKGSAYRWRIKFYQQTLRTLP